VVLGVYWDNPEVTPPDKCRVDACVSVPEGTVPEAPVEIQTIVGGPHAVCHFEISAGGSQNAREKAFAWLVNGGCECEERPCYELFHNEARDHPEGKWVYDIRIRRTK
jgi:AraC family transcriptional regulator